MFRIKRIIRVLLDKIGLWSIFWRYRRVDWDKAYWTPYETHRGELMRALSDLSFKSVLEVGCACGANLYRIDRTFKITDLAGCDISENAIKVGKAKFNADLRIGRAEKIPFEKKYDLVLTDACLMYVPDRKLQKAKEELLRVAGKYIVLVELEKDRDYGRLFKEFKVEKHKITDWDCEGWRKYGYITTVKL